MVGLQEPKGGFKLYLLFQITEKQWLKALHLPEQVATRATVSGPDVGRGEAAGEGEDGAVDVVEVGLGAQRADLGLPVSLIGTISISPGIVNGTISQANMANKQFTSPQGGQKVFYANFSKWIHV